LSEKLPTIIKPPEVIDQTDDDPDSEYLKLRSAKGYPTIDVDPTTVKLEIDYCLKVSRNKTVKAIALAFIGAVSVLLYTYLLLVT